MWTGLLNRPGPFEFQSSQTRRRARRETAREKDRHRDRKGVPWAAAAGAFSWTQRTTDQRKSMALFGMFRRNAGTHGLRRCELLGRRNSYAQKFGSPSLTLLELGAGKWVMGWGRSSAKLTSTNEASKLRWTRGSTIVCSLAKARRHPLAELLRSGHQGSVTRAGVGLFRRVDCAKGIYQPIIYAAHWYQRLALQPGRLSRCFIVARSLMAADSASSSSLASGVRRGFK